MDKKKIIKYFLWLSEGDEVFAYHILQKIYDIEVDQYGIHNRLYHIRRIIRGRKDKRKVIFVIFGNNYKADFKFRIIY